MLAQVRNSSLSLRMPRGQINQLTLSASKVKENNLMDRMQDNSNLAYKPEVDAANRKATLGLL